MDISLVPFNDLVKELESRCNSFICAYEFPEDNNKFTNFIYGKETWYNAIRLSAILNNDILNNWNGELKTLQKLNEDV